MTMKTIVMYEISQKQQYIFRTNRLVENIGASTIIRKLTEEPREFLLNIKDFLDGEVVDLPPYEKSIVGGGNATYIFSEKSNAFEFAQTLSASVLRYFPGVELFLVTKEINWKERLLYDGKNDKGILKQMRDALAEKKNRREHAVQQLSWGIHQVCPSSGLPANELWKDKDSNLRERATELIVKEVVGKLVAKSLFDKELIEDNYYLMDSELYRFYTEEDMKEIYGKDANENDAKNYLAIVHIDGNAMGVKVSRFLENPFHNNDDYLDKYERFTAEIDQSYKTAFKKMIHHVMSDYDIWAEHFYGEKKDVAKYIIPIRPVVASGDDICYITFGQLGIESARIFIQYLQQETMEIHNEPHTFEACAGVAIIKQKFPFWLGYELAEKLCSNAKKRLKQDEEHWINKKVGAKKAPYDTSLIDWELVDGGDLSLNIQEARSQYYQCSDGSSLVQRPFYLQKLGSEFRHRADYTQTFIHSMKLIKQAVIEENNRNQSVPPISKWKELRDIYHQGRTVVEQWQLLNQFDVKGCKLFIDYQDGFALINQSKSEHPDQGNNQYRAYFYDALEVADYMIPLREVKDYATANRHN